MTSFYEATKGLTRSDQLLSWSIDTTSSTLFIYERWLNAGLVRKFVPLPFDVASRTGIIGRNYYRLRDIESRQFNWKAFWPLP